eukprot:TRINITY_DN1149_c0_g1_i1.p1 TRINITY_DN1149_c0_g1~~TRINITY_DN1149_c0_g1_i1.p1  ORF type:complete len:965 (+),score=298.26 TRINITY_DN1149_c0_g1_i1:78-2897(+)
MAAAAAGAPAAPEGAAGGIVQLPEEVVNRIAAGEVVQRPSSAAKELLENSLDAGATAVDVTAQDGGIQLLRIEDDGHGIRRADLPLLCVRFATSKLRAFDDLQSIGTFGFRGEALASLSMVARVEVTTRSRSDPEGATWRARYREGEMVDCEQLPAGLSRPGTVIRATDLFYSNPQRRSVLARPQEEYRHVVDVVTRYALQHPKIRFCCRKTPSAMPCVSTRAQQTREGVVRQLYGGAVADALVAVTETHDAAAAPGSTDFTARVLMTSLRHFGGKIELVTFINGRLVEHDGIARMVRALYGALLPKRAYPFVYIDLTLPADKVDVNAHPSKEKVVFLHEEDLVQRLERAMAPRLAETQEEADTGSAHLKRKLSTDDAGFGVAPAKRPAPGDKSRIDCARPGRLDHQLVRTDSSFEQGALDGFVSTAGSAGAAAAPALSDTPQQSERSELETPASLSASDPVTPGAPPRPAPPPALDHTPGAAGAAGPRGGDLCSFSPTRLSTAQALLDEAAEGADQELRRELQQLVFVGWVNHRYSLVQLGLGLWMVDLSAASAELFYQLALAKWGGGMARLRLRPALPLEALLRRGAEAEGGAAEDERVVPAARRALARGRAVLSAYCGVDLDEDAGELRALPVLLRGHAPPLHRLPRFLLRLATRVDWRSEATCVRGLAEELADFYSLPDAHPEKDWHAADAGRPAPAGAAGGPAASTVAAAAAGAVSAAAAASSAAPDAKPAGAPATPPSAAPQAGPTPRAAEAAAAPAAAPTPAGRRVLQLPDALDSDSDESTDHAQAAALAAVRQRMARAAQCSCAHESDGPGAPAAAGSQWVPPHTGEAASAAAADGSQDGTPPSRAVASAVEGEDDCLIVSGTAAGEAAAGALRPEELVTGIWDPPRARWAAQHRILRALRAVAPPPSWRASGILRKVADLPTMYRIFERC